MLHDKAFDTAKNSKNVGYDRVLASMVYKCFAKTSAGTKTLDGAIKSEIILYQQVAEELHKPIIRKFEKRKVYSSLRENILLFYIG